MRKLIKSPLNYTGGKYRLLPQILPLFPNEINTFVDIFCGGANVGVNVKANQIVYNDSNIHLINLYKIFMKYDSQTIIDKIEEIIIRYSLSDSKKYGYEYYGCDSGSGLGKYNKDKYLRLRTDLNTREQKDDEYYLMLYTLIVFCFNNQIRFNGKNEFNLPVGKRDFNYNILNNLERFIDGIHSQIAEFVSIDFREYNIDTLQTDDFVYCDPPYLITTASYNESNGWTDKDERALLRFLDELNANNIRFALSNVTKHKGRVNDILIEWASNYNTYKLNFDYKNSNYHSKNTTEITEEVLITNF